MIWLIDPLVFAICSPVLPERCNVSEFQYAGVHRWYLLCMLMIKVGLIVFRVARVPPLFQCVFVSLIAFGLPPELGCLTEERCESTSTSDIAIWRGSLTCDPTSPLSCTRNEDGLRSSLAPVWKVLFQGAYADSWSMFSSIIMRYYALFAVIYFWTFYYGRPAANAFASATRTIGAGKGGSAIGRATAVVGLVAIELYQAALLGPRTYYLMQENYAGTYTPALMPTIGVLVLLVLAVILLVVAVGPDPHPPRLVRLAGSTTLGCYGERAHTGSLHACTRVLAHLLGLLLT